jgi:hypothetical protein
MLTRTKIESLQFRLKKALDSNRGYIALALTSTVAVIIILSVLIYTLIPYMESESSATQQEETSAKALYIAEAGINNYLWHLNQDEDYFETQVHPAQGQDEKGQARWVNYSDGAYHLDVEALTDSPGVIVTATGRIVKDSLTVERKIRAVIKKRSFAHYIYFTDHETVEGSGEKIWFITGDIIRGPLHSNDYIHIWGDPEFQKKVTTSRNLDIYPGSNPIFKEGYEEEVPVLEMPPTNIELKTWAQAGGYYYYGKTTITLKNSGYLLIENNNSQSTGPTGLVSLPANGVIYVDGQNGAKSNQNNGDVYIEGTLSGRLTIASKNNIYITGDLLYKDETADMLGLVAENYVYILHYKGYKDVAPYNIEINAAIFAVNHSFSYEKYYYGPPKGTITLKGALVQKYRGAVGTFYRSGKKRSGYSKDYYYDERMLYTEPPHFIEPLNSGFEIIKWEETRD